MSKIFVEVVAQFLSDGSITPLYILWKDGRKFEIDRINDVRRASSLKSGGLGIRYQIMLFGQQRYLFLEDDKHWFIEK